MANPSRIEKYSDCLARAVIGRSNPPIMPSRNVSHIDISPYHHLLWTVRTPDSPGAGRSVTVRPATDPLMRMRSDH